MINITLVIFALLSWFFTLYSGVRSKPVLVGSAALGMLLFLINLIEPNTLLYSEIHGIERLLLPWGEEVFLPNATPSIWGIIASVYLLLVPVFGFYMLIRRFRLHRRRSTLSMLFALALLMAAMTQAVFVRVVGIHELPPLGAYGYLSMVIVMGITLTREMREDRKQVEEALLHSERKTRAILDQSVQFIGLMSPDGTLLEANRTALELAGVTPIDVLNKPFWESPWWNHSTELQNKLRESIKSAAAGEEVHFEASHPATDGNLRYVDFSLRPVKNEQGDIVYLIPEGHDITEQKKAEKELRQLNALLDTIIENIPNMLFIKDAKELRFIRFNKAGEHLLGYPKESLIGKNDYDFFPKEQADFFTAKDCAVLRSTEVLDIPEEYLQTNNKGIRILHTKKVTLFDVNGKAEYLLGISEDITERKHAEENLMESQRKLATLMGNLHGIAYRCMNDPDWTMIFMSEGCFDLTGFYPQELVGNQLNSYGKLIHPDDAKMVWQKVQDAIKNHTFWQIEYRIHTKVGKEKWVWEQGCGVFSNAGDLEVLEGFISDVTEQKHAEKVLQESEKRLQTFSSITSEGLMIHDNGIILDVNLPFANLFGYSNSEELIGKNAFDITKLTDKSRAIVVDHIQRNSTETYDIEIINLEGKEIPVETRGVEILYKAKKVRLAYMRDITERKLAEKALNESQRLLADTEKMGKVGGWEFYYETNKLVWTEETYHIHEVEPTFELTVEKAVNFYIPASKPIIEKVFKEALEEGKPYDVEIEIITHKGNIRNIHTIGTVDMEKKRVYGFIQDITERKLAEKALHESEEKYRYMVDSAPIGIFQRSIQGSFNFCNLTLAKQFECNSIDEFLLNYNELSKRWNDPEQFNEFNELLKKNGKVLGFENKVKLINGKTKWFALYYKLDSTKSLLDGFSLDITERKLAEQALKESEIKYHEAIEFQPIPIGIAMGDKIIHFNKEFIKTFGYTIDDVQSISHWMEIVYPDPVYREEVIRVWDNDIADAIQNNNITPSREYLITCKDLTVKWVVITSALVGNQLISTFENITERKKAEEALQKSEARYAFIANNTSDVIWTLNLKTGKYTYVSPSVQKLRGYTPDEVLNQTMAESLTPESLQKSIALMQERIANRKPGDTRNYTSITQADQPCKDGSVVSTEAVGTMVFDENGEPMEIIGVSRDITERKKAEEEILKAKEIAEEKEKRLRSYFQLGLLGMAITSPEKGIIEANDFLCTFLEYPKEELLQKTWIELTHPDDIDIDLAYLTKVVEGEMDSYKMEKRLISKSGRIVYTEISVTAIRKRDKTVDYFLGLINNITERKQAEVELQQSEVRLSALISSMKDIIFEIDLNGCFEGYYAQDIKGLYVSPDFFIKKKIDEVLPLNVSKLLNGAIENIYEGKQFEQFEYSLTIENIIQYESAVVTPRYNTSKEIIGITVVCRDITERKKNEAALLKLYTAINYSKVSIVITDIEGNIEFANPYFTELTGYSKDEYLGKNPKVLKSGIHTDEFYKVMWDTIKSGNTWEGELCNRKKNGELYWEKSIITPIKNEKEEIINFVAVKSDITNEKKNEYLIDITLEIYKKSEQLTIEEILKYSIELGIILTDSEIGFFHFVNDDQETISLQAWSAKTMEICNIPTLDKHYPISKAGVWVDCFYQKKSVFHNDYSSLSHKKGLPKGHATLTRDLSVPVIIENKVVAIFGVGNKKFDYNKTDAELLSIFAENVWNVIRRKNAETDTIKAKEKAEESDRLKTQFLLNMSH